MSDQANSGQQRKRLFISYHHVEPDQTVARHVADALGELHDVFIDQQILPGRDWGNDIEGALQTAEFLIAFLSQAAVESDGVVNEIQTAHERNKKTDAPVIIPVRLGFDGQLPYRLGTYLNRFQHIVWGGPEDTPHLIDQLIGALAGGPAPKSRGSLPTRDIGPNKRSQTIDVSARQNRFRAIRRIRFHIEAMLQHSLYKRARLELGLMEKSDAVEWTLDIVVQRPHEEPRPLPPGTKISSVFDEQLNQLLILGAPGAGKTTLLLELAQDLLNRAEVDEDKSFPVVFYLSSWATNRRPLADWLADEMNKLYDIPYELAQEWLRPGRVEILPFLDGLDEVALEHREECVEAINAFRKENGLVPILVCSRIAEYEALTLRLQLLGAVVIQPLTPVQIQEYLYASREEAFDGLRAALQADTTLWELLDTPLMLSVAILAHKDPRPDEILAATLAERRDHLFAKYVDAMFKRRGKEARYTRDQTIRWLAWLASGMTRLNQSIFQLESLDLNWLATRAEQRVAGLVLGTPFGLLFGLIFGLVNKAWSNAGNFYFALCMLVVAEWVGWRSRWRIGPVIVYRWSWPVGIVRSRAVLSSVLVGLVFGPILFMAFPHSTLALSFKAPLIVTLFSSMLLGGLFFGLMAAVLRIIEASITAKYYKIPVSAAPNDGTQRAAWNALGFGAQLGLIAGLFLGLVFGLFTDLRTALDSGLLLGLTSGLLYAFAGGGAYCVRHFIVRLLLWRRGFGPWKYVRFLDYAADRLFLRKVGGGYIFLHRMLMDYFATMPDEAIAQYRNAPLLKPNDAYALTKLGFALYERGRYDEAMGEYRKAIQLKPRYFQAHNNLGAALQKKGKYDEAIAEYRRAIELKPSDFQAHINLGLALHDQGWGDEAISECKNGINFARKALALNPKSAYTRFALGIALAKLEQFDDAIAEYRKALAIEPDDPAINNGLGYLLAERGRFDEAMSYVQKALRLKPNDPNILDSLGFTLAGKGQCEAAIAKYREALNTSPENANIHYHLAQTLEKSGSKEEADQEFKMAHQLAPALYRPSN